jgi:hypothetical protein
MWRQVGMVRPMSAWLGLRDEISPVPWSRTERWIFAGFAVAVVASLGYLVHPWYEARRDAAIYVDTARSLLAGEGYRFLGEPFRIRPPGFSALIAPVIGIFGTHFGALNLLVSALGAIGVFLLYLYERSRLGWVLALLVAGVVWLNPGYQRFCNQVMSDIPGMTLLVGCLLIEGWSARSFTWKREGLLGLSIGLASYVRASTLILVPAIIVSRLLARRGAGDPPAPWGSVLLQRTAAMLAVVALLLAPWTIRNQIVETPASWDQTKLHSYATAFLRQDPKDPTSALKSPVEILARIQQRSAQIGEALGSRLDPERTDILVRLKERGVGAAHFAIAVVVYLCLLLVGIRRRSALDFYLLFHSVIIGLYFGFSERLVLPVFVFGIAAVAQVLRDSVQKIAGIRVATGVAAAVLVGLLVVDFEPRAHWKNIEEKHDQMVEISATIRSSVPPDARLAARLGHSFIVFLEQPVFSFSEARHEDASIQLAEGVIARYGIDAVILRPNRKIDQTIIPYFRKNYTTLHADNSVLVVQIDR